MWGLKLVKIEGFLKIDCKIKYEKMSVHLEGGKKLGMKGLIQVRGPYTWALNPPRSCSRNEVP